MTEAADPGAQRDDDCLGPRRVGPRVDLEGPGPAVAVPHPPDAPRGQVVVEAPHPPPPDPDHPLRPFRRERVSIAQPRDALTSGLSERDVVLYSGERIFGWTADEYVSDDVFTHVVDLEEVAPFMEGPAIEGTASVVNGMTSADAWKYIYYMEGRGAGGRAIRAWPPVSWRDQHGGGCVEPGMREAPGDAGVRPDDNRGDTGKADPGKAAPAASRASRSASEWIVRAAVPPALAY